ncbi:hypothetical protein NPIL_80631, partial [Nephila pilipes]
AVVPVGNAVVPVGNAIVPDGIAAAAATGGNVDDKIKLNLVPSSSALTCRKSVKPES